MEAPESESDEGSAATVTLLDALSRGRLVGRTVELAQARDLWRRAREGRGYAVLVGGEPGAGKTRFAREVIIQAALDGAMVLTGACYEYEATTPYLPFVEAFRRWVREQKSDTKLSEVLGDASAQLAKLAPEIEARIGPFPERHELPPHEERLLFFDTVAKALAELAHSQGLLFYIDDLHWADSGTLWLLGHLLRYTRDKRVLVVASYRETELHRSHPLAKALVDWNRERLTARIVLRRFTRDETQAQLSALLGQEDFADFADAVHRETEGNPFFIEEVLKALIEQGSVRREGGRWERSEIGDLVIPQSVKEAIGNRLDRVSQKCNDVLRAAAVLGKTFTFDELMAATGSNEEEALLDALDEGVAAQLIASDREAAFTFTHDKIREVLYEELNPIRRRRLHRRTAEGLERAREQNSVPVETLAHHYIEAGDYERGLDYAKRAAVEAERVFAFDEAIAAYGRARDCAESLGLIDEQVALEEAIGKACILSGDSIRASEHFERALVLATEPVQRARLQCEAASSLVTTGDKRGLDYVREALATLDPGTYPLETANALSIEGRFHHLAGMHHKAVELLEKAVELATPAVESATLTSFAASTITNIYAYLSGAHQHLGRFADADRWARRNLDFGNKYNVPLAQATGYEFLGEDACSSGDWKMGLEYAAREREIAAKLHSRERLAWTYMVTSLCAMFLGDLEYAERESVDGIALAQSVGERRLVTLLMGNLAIFQADLGQLDQALETGRENFERAEVLGLPYSRTEARRCLAHVRLRRGELAEALRLCEEVLELVAGTESRISRLWLGPLHVETLMAAGRDDEAKERLSAYRELVSECQSPLFERETTRLERLLQNN
jgi:tetratricopeptide (TPR) repeat protein